MEPSYDRKAFIERLLARLHALLDQHIKADILIMVGRKDEQTGEELPPRVEVREHELRFIL